MRVNHPRIQREGLAGEDYLESLTGIAAYSKEPCQPVSAATWDYPKSLAGSEKSPCDFVQGAVSAYSHDCLPGSLSGNDFGLPCRGGKDIVETPLAEHCNEFLSVAFAGYGIDNEEGAHLKMLI